MPPAPFSIVALLVVAAATARASDGQAPTSRRTNVLVIVADDLGYSDLGCYGSEIQTPILDRLACNGLRLTQFYNTARCWPTRAAILTGYYAQQVHRDALPGVPGGGTKGKRPRWARLLPDFLKPLGYRSYHSGKWHVDGTPLKGGFDRSYCLNDHSRYFDPQAHLEDDQPLLPVERDSGYYATTAIADHAIRCLKDHAERYAARPFFHFLAFTAPHFPLQALPDDIARYRDLYRKGWEAVRCGRWQRMRQMGLLCAGLSPLERDVGPPYDFPQALQALGDGEVSRPLAWCELTDQQRDFQATKMAVHAAMIHRMDREIGRVLDQLRAMQAFDDTLILFLSDNGASAEIMVRGDGHSREADPGSRESFLCLGPGFSSAANAPFRRHKTWVHEGGIATPFIVHWPRGISERGALRHNVGHVIDIVPTVLEATGCRKPEAWAGEPIPAAPGKSLVPVFARDCMVSRDCLWWLHNGNRAVRVGDWKLVAAHDEPWELYDLRADRIESCNLATARPEKVAEFERIWNSHLERFQRLAAEPAPTPMTSYLNP